MLALMGPVTLFATPYQVPKTKEQKMLEDIAKHQESLHKEIQDLALKMKQMERRLETVEKGKPRTFCVV